MTYWHLARAAFRQQTQYRLAMVAGLFTNIVFGFIRASILFAALDSAGGTLAGYDRGQMGAYVWLSQGLLGAVQMGMGPSVIGERVKSGDIAIDVARPVDIQLSYLAADLGRAAYTFLPRGLPSVLVGALTVGLTMPSTVGPYALGLVSVTAAVAIGFLGRFTLVDLPGFWLVETRGMMTFYGVTGTFLAGLYVPVALFPQWLDTVAHATPFPSMLQAPIDVLSGRVTGDAALATVGTQLAWCLALAVAGRLVLRLATIKLVVQGG